MLISSHLKAKLVAKLMQPHRCCEQEKRSAFRALTRLRGKFPWFTKSGHIPKDPGIGDVGEWAWE